MYPQAAAQHGSDARAHDHGRGKHAQLKNVNGCALHSGCAHAHGKHAHLQNVNGCLLHSGYAHAQGMRCCSQNADKYGLLCSGYDHCHGNLAC